MVILLIFELQIVDVEYLILLSYVRFIYFYKILYFMVIE